MKERCNTAIWFRVLPSSIVSATGWERSSLSLDLQIPDCAYLEVPRALHDPPVKGANFPQTTETQHTQIKLISIALGLSLHITI
jgi:hypothetical protein